MHIENLSIGLQTLTNVESEQKYPKQRQLKKTYVTAFKRKYLVLSSGPHFFNMAVAKVYEDH